MLVNSAMLRSRELSRSSIEDGITAVASGQASALSWYRSGASGSSQSILQQMSVREATWLHYVWRGKKASTCDVHSNLRDKQRRHAWLRGSRSQRVFSLRQVLHAVMERRIRLLGRVASFPVPTSALLASCPLFLLFLSLPFHDGEPFLASVVDWAMGKAGSARAGCKKLERTKSRNERPLWAPELKTLLLNTGGSAVERDGRLLSAARGPVIAARARWQLSQLVLSDMSDQYNTPREAADIDNRCNRGKARRTGWLRARVLYLGF